MAGDAESLALLVRKLSSRVDIAPADRSAILALPYTVRPFDTSTYLVREGEAPGPCAVLLSGFAARHKQTSGGGKQIIAVHVPGEALDFQHLFLDEADHNVQTLSRGRAALIPRQALRDLAEARPGIARAITIDILAEGSVFREWILNVGRREARARIAHLLCEFAMRLDAQGLSGTDGYLFPMTQEQIGDATGLTAVHVNRMLKTLEADRLVSRHGRNVTFPDWRALREVADFEERYLHLKKQNAGGDKQNSAASA